MSVALLLFPAAQFFPNTNIFLVIVQCRPPIIWREGGTQTVDERRESSTETETVTVQRADRCVQELEGRYR